MSKRVFTALVVLLVVAIMAPIFPVAAQGDTPATPPPAPAACTDEEHTQILDAFKAFNEQYGSATQVSGPMDNIANIVKAVAALETARQYLHTDMMANLPYCTDTMVLITTLEFVLDNTELTMFASANLMADTEAGNLDAITAGTEIVTFHSDKMMTYYDRYTKFTTALEAGPVMAEWVPACTADDLKAEDVAKLDELVALYNQNLPAIQAFVTDGTFDGAVLTTLEKDILPVWEPLSDSAPQCHELIVRLADEGYLYYNTALALSMAKLAEYANSKQDTETAQTLTDMQAMVVKDLQNELKDWVVKNPAQ